MTTLASLRPFSEGNANEIEEGVVRIYDRHGFPRIEVFLGPNDIIRNLDQLAAEIREVLNARPNRSGP